LYPSSFLFRHTLLFSSPFYRFVFISFLLSFRYFPSLCICVGFNSRSLICGMWKSQPTKLVFYGFLL
jgi:hypothetical protein